MRNLNFMALPFIVMVLLSVTTHAQTQQLHTIFINSFIEHIEWPSKYSKGDFEIAVLGESPILPHLLKLAEVKKINNRNIVVRRIISLNDAKKVNILFIPESSSENIDEALKKFRKRSTLIITESEGYGAKGSNINFVTRNGRETFEMNMQAMEDSKLKVSYTLVRQAIEI